MTIIYVAAAVGSSGAFEWRETFGEAVKALADITSPADDTCIRRVEVASELLADDEHVTDWLDAHPEVWEPRPGQRHNAADAPEPAYDLAHFAATGELRLYNPTEDGE